MHRLRSQADKLRYFVDAYQVPEKEAKYCLEASDWHLERAANFLFEVRAPQQQQRSGSGGASTKQINKIFETAKAVSLKQDQSGLNENLIGPNGLVSLLSEIGIDMESMECLIFNWKCQPSTEHCLSRTELSAGCNALGASSYQDLKKRLIDTRKRLVSPSSTEDFKNLYRWTFGFAKTVDAKFLEKDLAVEYWKLLLPHYHSDRRLIRWFQFLDEQKKTTITQDLWNCFYSFLVTIDEEMNDHSGEDSWPLVIDEFVENARSNAME